MVVEVRGASLTLLSAHNFYSPAATLVPDTKQIFSKQQNFAAGDGGGALCHS